MKTPGDGRRTQVGVSEEETLQKHIRSLANNKGWTGGTSEALECIVSDEKVTA